MSDGESNHADLDSLPPFVFRDNEHRMEIEEFIEANLAAGWPLPDIAAAIIHPATGLPCSPEQLAGSFPDIIAGGTALANMKVTASLYRQARRGEKGDIVRASVKWLESMDGDKWNPAKKIRLDGQVDVNVQHRVEDAMDRAKQIIDGFATQKRTMAIEHKPDEVVDVPIPDGKIVDESGRE